MMLMLRIVVVAYAIAGIAASIATTITTTIVVVVVVVVVVVAVIIGDTRCRSCRPLTCDGFLTSNTRVFHTTVFVISV